MDTSADLALPHQRGASHLFRHVARAASVTLLGVALAVGTAVPGAEPDGGTVYGPEIALGKGTARTYVEVVAGAPVEVGVALSEAALSGLPDHHTPGGMPMPDGHSMFEFVLSMPTRNATPFQHVALNWNPGGHEPPGIYDTPHFDFHFNLISNAERQTITLDNPHFEAKVNRHPEAEYQPRGYVALPGGVPLMGAHWVDPTSPELNGQPFTKTFIYGSWDGSLIFAEPMITKAFIESRQPFTAPLPEPAKYAKPGFYPTSYSVRWDERAGEYRIALQLAERS